MNLNLRNPLGVMLSLFIVFSFFSCSKDSDLLSDYISIDEVSELFDIQVIGVKSQPLVIVPEEYGIPGTIVSVSEPQNGTVRINNDNTLTYVPNKEETGTDEFDYTSENNEEESTASTTEGTVEITTVNSKVEYWKAKFDTQYALRDGAAMMEMAKSGNKFQEYYYMYYYFDALLSIWRATGDNKYLDRMLEVVDSTIKDAKPVSFNSSYLGWPADSSYSQDYPKNGVALWESYYWKGVATLLRIMYQSPNLMAHSYKGATYSDEYKDILEFTEKNIWNKWKSKGNSYLYRENVHMASHWARIGMELYIITKNEKYKEVFDNISFKNTSHLPSVMRERLRPHKDFSEAYVWDMSWDRNQIEDTWHASDVVSFWILAYENGMYWNRSDMSALVETLDKIVFSKKNAPNYARNVDGSGGFDTAKGRLRDWVKLGRFDNKLQERLINEYQSDIKNSRRYAIQNLANFALNEKYLADGKPVYPETF